MLTELTELDVTFKSGADVHLLQALFFVHVETVDVTHVEVDRSSGDPLIALDAQYPIGDFPVTDLSVFLSLGQALAIGEAAAAEMARLEAERPAQSEAKS